MNNSDLDPTQLTLMMFFPLSHHQYSDQEIISHLGQYDCSSLFSLIVPSCVQNNRLVLLDYFIEQGVILHITHDECINHACLYQNRDALEYLLNQGSSVEKALQYAQKYGFKEGENFIHYWSQLGHIKTRLENQLSDHFSHPKEKI